MKREICKLLKMNPSEKIDYIKNEINMDLFDLVEEEEFYYIFIPKILNNDLSPFLCSHIDIVSNSAPKKLLIDNNIVTSKNGILGADDTSGVWIMLNLMKENPNDFIFGFFDKEEVGTIGSRRFIKSSNFDILLEKISFWLGLDRRGYNDMVTYRQENQKIIDVFEELGYKYKFGSFSDVTILAKMSDISCINLSVGYNMEHTSFESLNLNYMKNTLNRIKQLPREAWNIKYDIDNKINYKNFEKKLDLYL